MVVFIVGLGPGEVGYVNTSLIEAVPAGTILLHLKWMNAFFTGRIPGDCKFLNPRMSISILYSDLGTLEFKSTFSGLNLKL